MKPATDQDTIKTHSNSLVLLFVVMAMLLGIVGYTRIIEAISMCAP